MRKVYSGEKKQSIFRAKEMACANVLWRQKQGLFQEARGEMGQAQRAALISQCHTSGKRQSWESKLVSPTLESGLFAFYFAHSTLL